jgi:hypothetical protein
LYRRILLLFILFDLWFVLQYLFFYILAMDPLSALGAAAASAQFIGYAVQGALAVEKLYRQVKDAPTDIEKLLKHVSTQKPPTSVVACHVL